jgi:hypothetical protein
MKKILFQMVGGSFHRDTVHIKSSSVVTKLNALLYEAFSKHYSTDYYNQNGGTLLELNDVSKLRAKDITIWMPNISNAEEKIYPTKMKGSILICSKVLRTNRTIHDAVNRIFKMHGNAVIAIEKTNKKFIFTLIDALGNSWTRTSDLKILAKTILEFYNWSKKVIRVGSSYSDIKYNIPTKKYKNLKKFCELNTKIADKVESGNTNRYFGNCSTRCSLLFPSMSLCNDNIMVSRRSSNKKRLDVDDMLMVRKTNKCSIEYMGDKLVKPSVDTPIQIAIYKKFPMINYMIHGHAYINNKLSSIPFTENYFSCGDLREVDDTIKLIKDLPAYAVNLRNHGFLLYAKTLLDIETFINKVDFIPKEIGKEFIL